MILEILRATPVWVFALFAYLIWVGAKRLQPSVRDVRRVFVMPLVFIVWGLSGLERHGPALPHAAAFWLLGAAFGAALGALPKPVLLADHRRRLVQQGGSAVPLLRNLALFGSHYLLNVAAAIEPRASADFIGWDVLVSGFSAGYFIAWAIRFAQVYRAAPQTDFAAAPPAALSSRG